MAATAPPPDRHLAEALRARGQRVTPQRLLLHRTLRELDRHVTAEHLLEAAGRRLPNLALPTVYATLELFEELGIVHRVPGAGGARLFDPRLEEHHHRVCTRCGSVEDLDVALDTGAALRAAGRGRFCAQRVEMTISGLCAACAD